MRFQKTISSVIIAFSLITASASGEDEKPTAPANFSKIVLGSSGGITGGGTGKALAITEDGKIETKNGSQQKNGQLKPEEIERLKQLTTAVNWEEVKEIYNHGADMFSADLSVTMGEKVRVTHVSDPQLDGVPKPLVVLLGYLNELHDSYKP